MRLLLLCSVIMILSSCTTAVRTYLEPVNDSPKPDSMHQPDTVSVR